MRTLSKIQFDADSANFAGAIGFQETDEDGTLVGLYDASGEQLNTSFHSFPSATWSLVEVVGSYENCDTDEFWNLVAVHGTVAA